jgi:hypothetical protein
VSLVFLAGDCAYKLKRAQQMASEAERAQPPNGA